MGQDMTVATHALVLEDVIGGGFDYDWMTRRPDAW